MIRYHNIQNAYSEFRTNTIQKLSTSDFTKLLKSRYNDEKSSIYEVIGNSELIKLYFDIECVPNDQVLRTILDKFQTFAKKSLRVYLDNYVVTKNHYIDPKKKMCSYHVIFTDYKLRLFDVRNLVGMFVTKHAEFNNFIDLQCYSVDNLFRSIGQYTIDHYNNVRSYNFENYHSLYNIKEERFYEDVEINDSMIGKTIIQNINDTNEFPKMIPVQPQSLINILIEHKKFRLSKNNQQKSDQQRSNFNESIIKSVNESIETQINESMNRLMNDSIKTFIEQTDSRFNQLNNQFNQFNSKNEIIKSTCFLVFILMMMLYMLYIINEFIQPTFFWKSH
jgi:hypothetical protein